MTTFHRSIKSLGLLAAVLSFVILSSVAGARGRADLSVAKVSGAPGKTLTGGRINLRVKVKNGGGARAGASKLVTHLAPEGATALADSVGRAKVGRIAARRTAKARIKVRIPLDTPAGRWRLVVCVGSGKGSNDCLTGKAFEVRDGSSWGRIEAARASGKLSAAKALLYELYALRGDKRLPKAYRGPGDIPSGTVFANLAATYPSLSAADQAKLAPYMIQPRYRQSAWAPSKHPRLAPRATASADPVCDDLDSVSGAWVGVKTTHAWFWARPDRPAARARARTLATEFERKIWPKLTKAFKTVEDSKSDLCDPLGDSRIDIYLAPPGNSVLGKNLGVTPGLFLSEGCGPRTSFIIIQENATRSTLAHEFMHVIQWAYPVCDRAPAWVEGTATWAMDYVYHSDQDEHGFKDGLQIPFISMLGKGEYDGYQAWTFWFSLVKKDRLAGLKRVFNSLAGGTDFPTALEAGPSDGLREAWKRFAIERWNQAPVGASGFPVAASFRNRSWDSFKVLPAKGTQVDVTIGNAGEKTFDLSSSTNPPLSTWFNPVKITDQKVRQVEFHNGDLGRPGSVVQAMIKLASGKWRLEDWSNRSTVKFCRDKPAENVVELVIATSNASARGGPLGEAGHKITAKPSCDPSRYVGAFTGLAVYDETQVGAGNTLTANWSGALDLRPFAPTPPNVNYQVISGSLNYSFSGQVGDCDVAGSTTVVLPTIDMNSINVMTISPGDPNTYQLTVGMPMFEQAPGTKSNCADPSQNGDDWNMYMGGTMVAHSDPALGAYPIPVPPDGVLSGSASGGSGGTPFQTWTWNLEPG
ncbi:MAG: hypothetical protein JJE13_07995 [Thermoleophilia bacterium]|nr:hypothetical protein [Thermoleophilia bacterium]